MGWYAPGAALSVATAMTPLLARALGQHGLEKFNKRRAVIDTEDMAGHEKKTASGYR